MLTFWLGVHRANWLSQTDVPLFLSRRQLVRRKTYPRARGPWAQDSGGFTELHLFGGWDTSVGQFVEQTRRHRDEIGHMAFAAPQDWMCEPSMLKQTGLSVSEHISRTVANYQTLMHKAPDVPWIPVLQGWQPDDYLHCWDAYDRAGISAHGCHPMTTTPEQEALPFASNDEWRWRWMQTEGRAETLHRIASFTHRETYDWVGVIGETVCGKSGRFVMPGVMSRMGARRCWKCAKVVGVDPQGLGAPYNNNEHESGTESRDESWARAKGTP